MKSVSFSEFNRRLQFPVFNEPVNVIVPDRPNSSERHKISSVLSEMMDIGDYIMDARVREAECALEKFLQLNNRKIFLISHGRLGLLFALESLGIGDDARRDEIICPCFAYQAVSDAITMRRLKPVYVDIDPLMFNACPDQIKRSLSPRTAAVLLVDNYGLPNDYALIQKIINKHAPHAKLIIDSAESFGSTYKDFPVGKFGDAVVLSFSFSKTLQCGKGGAVIFSSAMAEKIIHEKNSERKVWFKGCQLDPFRAVNLMVKIGDTNKNIIHRNKIAQSYKKELLSINGLSFQLIPSWASSVHTHYPILINPIDFGMNRDMLKWFLAMNNIFTKEYFHSPLVKDSSIQQKSLKNTAYITKNVLALPIGSGISEQNVKKICKVILWLHQNSTNALIHGIINWPNKAIMSIELGDLDIARALFSMTAEAFRFLKCAEWQNTYENILSLFDKESPETIIKKILSLQNSWELSIKEHQVNISCPAEHIVYGNIYKRLALHRLQGDNVTDALNYYAQSKKMFKFGTYDEMSAFYDSIHNAISVCQNYVRKIKSGSSKRSEKDTILIIGINGFLGRNLTKHLLREGIQNIVGIGKSHATIKALKKLNDYKLELEDNILTQIEYIECDISKPGIIETILNKYKFKTIINLAPYSDIAFFNSEPVFNIQSMLGHGYLKILEYCRIYGTTLVQMSTAILYKGVDVSLKNEQAEIDPFQDIYCEAKRIMEILPRLAGVKTITLRTANMYGLDDQKRRVIPLFIERTLEGKILYVSNDIKEFIHVDDVAMAIKNVINRRIRPGIYNLGNNRPVAIKELAQDITKIISAPQKSRISYIKISEKSGIKKVMNSSKLHKLLQWKPAVSLHDGLDEKVNKL